MVHLEIPAAGCRALPNGGSRRRLRTLQAQALEGPGYRGLPGESCAFFAEESLGAETGCTKIGGYMDAAGSQVGTTLCAEESLGAETRCRD